MKSLAEHLESKGFTGDWARARIAAYWENFVVTPWRKNSFYLRLLTYWALLLAAAYFYYHGPTATLWTMLTLLLASWIDPMSKHRPALGSKNWRWLAVWLIVALVMGQVLSSGAPEKRVLIRQYMALWGAFMALVRIVGDLKRYPALLSENAESASHQT